MKRFLCLILLSFQLYATAQDPANQYFLSLRRNQGQSIYSKESYTTLEASSFPTIIKEPFANRFKIKNAYPFIDLRYHQFDNSGYAMSTGLGVRFDSTTSNRIYGVNAYYDYRRGCRSGFHQLGLGFELLGFRERWNFRLNGYLPVGNKSRLCFFCLFDEYIGDFFFIHEKFRDSLRGINFEVERLFRDDKTLALAIGPYYYNRKKGCQTHMFGSYLRMSKEFLKYCRFSVLASYDNIFKGRIQAQIGVTLPFYYQTNENGKFHIANLNPQLYQRVQRNDAIILKSRNRWTWNW